MSGWSWTRWWGIVLKEFRQLRRDRVSFAMVIGVPIIQMVLFGYAINSDPRHLPTAVIVHEPSEFTRSFVAAMQHSSYFDVLPALDSEALATAALDRGEVMFVLTVPPGFTRSLLRGERPDLLVEADATDPTATGMALSVLPELARQVALRELDGPWLKLRPADPPFGVIVHRRYNPEGITQYNIIPGLMGVVMSMTLVMMTGLAMTRERERGTMENLLATPVQPLEVITGKIVPYVLIGLVQATVILLGARGLFDVPFSGNLLAVYLAALLFIAASLAVGITLSSLARNQLQAVQLTIFYFLPNILLSGFMFPFRGMPEWAQRIGSILPLTHFNRLMRGILLKGNGWAEQWPHIWPQLLFTALVMLVAVLAYRKTLD
ncbi:ABC transporter permease [Chitinilyticum piscinae]|uniref:ABC transporter permease n=1 Tax=Chitinilyticum piscinae TaxID=2866724 RepID=A0A8J7G2S9_9NEIS|nr:ABC transporter permease [Chitinilyticum piscinae]MBE9610313.1 ABC transporter permease [Chitinilyticum piscinae]